MICGIFIEINFVIMFINKYSILLVENEDKLSVRQVLDKCPIELNILSVNPTDLYI